MLFALLSAVLILAPMVIKRDWQIMYFSILLGTWFAVFLTFFVSSEEVARYYVVILSAMAAYSLAALYILRPMADNGLITVPVFYNATGWDFQNFGLSFASVTWARDRNFGAFREPGVYQFFLILALYLNNYHVCWKKNWQLWTANVILAVTMLSTLATGGVAELGLLVVVMFFDKKWYKDKQGRIIAAAAVLAVAAVVVFIVVRKGSLYYELYDMVFKFVSNPESSGARIGSIVTDLTIFLQNPILGEKMAVVLGAVQDNTTSTMILYAVLGILGGSLNVIAWIALVWKKEQKLWVNLALLLILFMSFNTQNLTTNIYFWLFPYMALVERGVPMLKKA